MLGFGAVQVGGAAAGDGFACPICARCGGQHQSTAGRRPRVAHDRGAGKGVVRLWVGRVLHRRVWTGGNCQSGVWLPVIPSPPARAAWSDTAAARRGQSETSGRATGRWGSDLRRPRVLAASRWCSRGSGQADQVGHQHAHPAFGQDPVHPGLQPRTQGDQLGAVTHQLA